MSHSTMSRRTLLRGLGTAIALPVLERELFFDIEDDPMRGIVYLHGFVERVESVEKYHAFFSEHANAESEREAFKAAWEFLQDRFLLDPDHGIIRPGHPDIGDVSRALRQNRFVGGRDVRVRANHRRYAPVQIPAQGQFLSAYW